VRAAQPPGARAVPHHSYPPHLLRSTSTDVTAKLTRVDGNPLTGARGMSQSKEDAKTAKKAAKALVKAEKKGSVGGGVDSSGRRAATPTSSPVPDAVPATPNGPTAAERSAAAAERQVALQRYRVLLAVLMLVVALAAIMTTTKPWQFLPAVQDAASQPPASQTDDAREGSP